MADDVLDLDDGIVDEDTGDQRQGQQADPVQREAHEVHEGERRDRRQRDRDRRDRRRAPFAQEEEDDHDREDGALDQRFHRRAEAALGQVDGREHLGDRHVRIRAADIGKLRLDAVQRRDVGKTLGLVDPEQRRRPAVEPGDAAHLGDAVTHIGDVRQAHETSARNLDLRAAEGKCGGRAAEHADRLLAAGQLRPATGGVLVQCTQRLVDLDRSDAEGLHAARVEVDADLAIDPTAALDLRDAGDTEQALGDGVVDEPRNALGRAGGRADGILHDGAAFDVHALYLRLEDALWQLGADAGDRIAHIADRAVDGRADPELDEDPGLALDGARLDVAHADHGGDRTLDLLHDLLFDLDRRGPRLLDEDRDRRERDVGIEIHRQADEGDDADEGQHHKHDDRRDRVADRPGRHVLHGFSLPSRK